MMLTNYILVATGGAVGAVLRFGCTQLGGTKNGFPFTTLFINIGGSLLIGLLFGLQQQGRLTEKYWLLLAAGLCGGFTTFSAFSLENMVLLQQQKWGLFILYTTSSVAICLVAVYAGYRMLNNS
jgi:fluoride exporter